MPASSQPLVSVIVPAYNAATFIADTLISILDQTYENKELIIINDGSTDATETICLQYTKLHPYIQFLAHKGGVKRGVSHSRALGVSAAKGELVAFCDADDIMVPHKLQRQVELLTEYPTAILCHSAIKAIGPDSAFSEQFEKAINFSDSIVLYELLRKRHRLNRNTIANSTVVVRKQFLDTVRIGRDQLFQFEDWLLWLLLAQEGPFLYSPDILLRYRFHYASATARMVDSKLYGMYARLEMYVNLLISLKYKHAWLRSEVVARIFQTFFLILKETKSG